MILLIFLLNLTMRRRITIKEVGTVEELQSYQTAQHRGHYSPIRVQNRSKFSVRYQKKGAKNSAPQIFPYLFPAQNFT